MNASGHAALGACTGAGVVLLFNKSIGLKTEPGDVAIGALLGGMAGLIPDFLEPATHPHHRALCHSMLTLFTVSYASWKLYYTPKLTPDQKKLLTTLAGGFLSHLVGDSFTPIGLPLLG